MPFKGWIWTIYIYCYNGFAFLLDHLILFCLGLLQSHIPRMILICEWSVFRYITVCLNGKYLHLNVTHEKWTLFQFSAFPTAVLRFVFPKSDKSVTTHDPPLSFQNVAILSFPSPWRFKLLRNQNRKKKCLSCFSEVWGENKVRCICSINHLHPSPPQFMLFILCKMFWSSHILFQHNKRF